MCHIPTLDLLDEGAQAALLPILITSTSAGRWPVKYAKSMATLSSLTAFAYTALHIALAP